MKYSEDMMTILNIKKANKTQTYKSNDLQIMWDKILGV